MTDAPRVVNEPGQSRFVAAGTSEEAELVYRRRGDRLVLVHTEVPVALEGHGIGGQLVAAAVEYAAAEGLTVVPSCPFARSWLDRHPDVTARAKVDVPR